MLTESCVMFFFAVPCCCKHYIARWIFWPWRLELKKETRQAAISLWRQLELTPNYLISYLKNTVSRSTRYVSMPHPNESSILPKFIEKSDPEVARPAFSTWPVQKTQPKAFEECTSIQIASNPPISVSRPLVVQNHNPAPHRDVCNFRSSKRKSLVTNQLSAAEFSRVIRRLCVCFDSANRFWSVQNHSTSKDEKETVSFPGEKMLVSLQQQKRDSSRTLILSIFNEG